MFCFATVARDAVRGVLEWIDKGCEIAGGNALFLHSREADSRYQVGKFFQGIFSARTEASAAG